MTPMQGFHNSSTFLTCATPSFYDSYDQSTFTNKMANAKSNSENLLPLSNNQFFENTAGATPSGVGAATLNESQTDVMSYSLSVADSALPSSSYDDDEEFVYLFTLYNITLFKI